VDFTRRIECNQSILHNLSYRIMRIHVWEAYVSRIHHPRPRLQHRQLANQWLSEMSLVGSMYHAFNPDLSGLQARGAKMIVMNGATDTSVTPKDASRYYDMVVQTMGQANADKVLETFIQPGVGHCVGGIGPDTVDLMKALATWVEAGTPPSAQNLTLSKLDANAGAVTMTRPLCKYPSYPRYNGSGDVNAASSFTCSTQ
jgi:feruloyl esterase